MSRYQVQMKPTCLAKKARRICQEYLVEVEANDKHQAAIVARNSADRDGMHGYAITKVTTVPQ